MKQLPYNGYKCLTKKQNYEKIDLSFYSDVCACDCIHNITRQKPYYRHNNQQFYKRKTFASHLFSSIAEVRTAILYPFRRVSTNRPFSSNKDGLGGVYVAGKFCGLIDAFFRYDFHNVFDPQSV